jgi:hypothetical protein
LVEKHPCLVDCLVAHEERFAHTIEGGGGCIPKAFVKVLQG